MIINSQKSKVNSYKYLGHVLCNSKNVQKAIYEHPAIQAQKAMYALKENTKSTAGYLPPKLSMKMFDTHILPILEYNSEICFPEKQIDTLEKVQMKFLKNMLGVRCQTSTIAILADIWRFPLFVRQQVSALKFLNRLRSNTCPSLLQSCYEIQTELYQKGKPCWLTRLCKVTETLNMNHNEFDLNKTIVSVYEQAHAKMLHEINDSVRNPKLRTYKIFKKDIRIEPYLYHDFPKSIYCNIARFRLSSHNLNIELGRHKRPFVPAEERTCEKCNLNQVEDEFHCLMICEQFNAIRNNLFDIVCKCIDNFFVLNPSEQFLQILTSKDTNLNCALGKFLKIAIKLDRKT